LQNYKQTSVQYFLVQELLENGATIPMQRNSEVKKNIKASRLVDWHRPPFPTSWLLEVRDGHQREMEHFQWGAFHNPTFALWPISPHPPPQPLDF
jgi:hypothetical protein